MANLEHEIPITQEMDFPDPATPFEITFFDGCRAARLRRRART
jgi:hypothetical protein